MKYFTVLIVELIIWVIWIVRNGINAVQHNPEIKDQLIRFKFVEFTVGMIYLLIIVHIYWVLNNNLKFKWFVVSISILAVVFASFYMFYIDTFANILFGLDMKPSLGTLQKSLIGNIVLLIMVSFSFLAASVYWEYIHGRMRNQYLENENRNLQTISQKNDKKSYAYDDRIFIKDAKKARFVEIKEIRCICAEGNYSKILFSDKNAILVLKNLKSWETTLPAKHFIRIHHSTIININHIENIENWFKNNFRVYIKGLETPFEISRRKLSKLQS